MRKMIWCGGVVLFAGVCAVYFAAYYAAENPDSLVARCARAAYYVGMRCNPLVLLNQRPAEQAFAGRPVPGAGLPLPAPEIPGEEPEEAPLQQPEAVESIIVEDTDPVASVPVGQTAEPARIPEDDAGLAPADDNVEKLPLTMPYADEDDADVDAAGFGCACMTGFFKQLLQGSEQCKKERPACNGLMESVVEFVRELLGQDGDAMEEAEVPADPVQIGPGPDGEEAQDSRALPNPNSGLREDPYYHHQYPGCPYSGPCPYPHSPVLPPVTKPSKKSNQPRPQSHLNVNEDRIMQWTTEAAFTSILNHPEGIVHPEVDTMECRPTDVPDLGTDETF
jgi:hypothetical protein